ncbi:MAG: hypothetical protein QUS09_01530, partial [Methanotrichaceae archaeon]|nr:hypothetical protein [Methanotrichaceae archaeon]
MPVENLNLDRLAAKCAQEMVKKAKEDKTIKKPVDTLERLATKALGVLQEQGVYAMTLFLFSRSSDEKKVAPHIRSQLYEALKKIPGFESSSIPDSAEEALGFYISSVLN